MTCEAKVEVVALRSQRCGVGSASDRVVGGGIAAWASGPAWAWDPAWASGRAGAGAAVTVTVLSAVAVRLSASLTVRRTYLEPVAWKVNVRVWPVPSDQAPVPSEPTSV